MTAAKVLPSFDATAFPSFKSGHVLPPKITSAKIKNPDLRGCLSASIFLASQIQLAEGSVHLMANQIRSIYFRAALAELVRVEDITKALRCPFILKDTSDPLLHVMKLLRNYQVHIGDSAIAAGSIAVLYEGVGVSYESFIVDNLSACGLRELDSAKNYSNEQLDELVSLFDVHQRKFGVVQLLYNTCLHIGGLLAKL